MRTDDQDAFESFVRARYPELLRFGRALTGSAEDGADLVQDALVRTLSAWSRVESHGDPEGYVRRTMVNRNISLWRRLRRDREHRQQREPPPDEPDTAARLDVWAAVRGLPPRMRTVIALRYFAGLPVAEVAALMSCSPGTVKSQSSKAINQLRGVLGDHDLQDEEVSDGPLHD